MLSKISQAVTPVLHPIGVRDDNWQATVGIVTGIFAKEAVVGTLNSLYAGSGDGEGGERVLPGEQLPGGDRRGRHQSGRHRPDRPHGAGGGQPG